MTGSITRRAAIGAGLAAPFIATGLNARAATYDNESIIRNAYRTAEGNVLDTVGFAAGFAEDGIINLGHAGVGPIPPGAFTFTGDKIGQLVLYIAKYMPDVHRELHRVNVLGDVVCVELSIQGTFLGPLETPAGIVKPNGNKINSPGADFWYLSEGKIKRFDCYILVKTIDEQMGIETDYASAVARSASK
jgi:SnoaL-like domain